MVQLIWYDTAEISKIKEAAENEDWFTAITLSATQLERHSYWVFKEYLESRRLDSKLVKLLLERSYLKDFARYLRVLNVIEEKEFNTIMEINSARNNYVHRIGKEKIKRGREAQQAYPPLVNAAIEILETRLNAKVLFVGR